MIDINTIRQHPNGSYTHEYEVQLAMDAFEKYIDMDIADSRTNRILVDSYFWYNKTDKLIGTIFTPWEKFNLQKEVTDKLMEKYKANGYNVYHNNIDYWVIEW